MRKILKNGKKKVFGLRRIFKKMALKDTSLQNQK